MLYSLNLRGRYPLRRSIFENTIVFQGGIYVCANEEPRDIQLSFLHIHPLSDVSLLDALMSFASVGRYAPFPPAFHVAVSSNAVGVRYAVLGSPSRN